MVYLYYQRRGDNTLSRTIIKELLSKMDESFTEYPEHKLNSCCVEVLRIILNDLMEIYLRSEESVIK